MLRNEGLYDDGSKHDEHEDAESSLGHDPIITSMLGWRPQFQHHNTPYRPAATDVVDFRFQRIIWVEICFCLKGCGYGYGDDGWGGG